MDWPLLLHVLRAAALAAVAGGAVVIVKASWHLGLPSSVTTTGVEWASTLQAPDRDFREQLIRVERESKAATDELHQVVAGLARRLQIDPGLETLEAALGR